MRTYSYLNQSQLEKDFQELYSRYNYSEAYDENTAWGIIQAIADDVNDEILEFLKRISNVDDENIRDCCRQAALSQMFSVELSNRGVYPYMEYCNSLVLIQFKDYHTAVVSKYGDILIDESEEIWTHRGLNYDDGFVVKNLKKGKWGFLSNSGVWILPCIFDDTSMHVAEYNFLLNHVNFRLDLCGEWSDLEEKDIRRMIEDYDNCVPKCIYGLYDEGHIFSLTLRNLLPSDSEFVPTSEEEKFRAIKEVITSLQNMIITRNQIVEKQLAGYFQINLS